MRVEKNVVLRISIGIFSSFILTFILIWFVCTALAKREASKHMDSIVNDLKWEIEIALRWQMQTDSFAIRDTIDEANVVNNDLLKKLVSDFSVSDISIVNHNGDIIHSSNPDFLSYDGNKLLNIRESATALSEFTVLLDSKSETWHYQPVKEDKITGELESKVGIWLPKGDCAIISYSDKKLRDVIHSLITFVFSCWDEGLSGGVVLTTKDDVILADYREKRRIGDLIPQPGDDCYWIKEEFFGFYAYVILPKADTMAMRNVLIGLSSGLNLLCLIITSILVSLIVARFVRLRIKEQIAKEMEMARDIQTAFLPNDSSNKIHDTRVKLFATMDTAKDVGGDFYDYYLLPSDKLFFAIADVSGKGVPGAMFMMRTKAVVKALVDKGLGVAQILEQANQLLCEGNASNTFVTMWVGILNLKTGELTYSSAGHNPPIIKQDNKAYYLKNKNGLVLGALDSAKYSEFSIKLNRGDIIYLYTDGITEQRNKDRKLFGENRLLQLFNAENIKEKSLLKEIYSSVLSFADGVDQDDDCTQMVLRYRGNYEYLLEKKYLPTIEGIAEAAEDLKVCLDFMPQKELRKMLVAADEIFANIVNYSGANEWSLKISKVLDPNGITLTFADDGREFDPIGVESPDVTLSSDKRKIGGNGLYIVKKRMTSVAYVRRKGYNILTLTLEYAN